MRKKRITDKRKGVHTVPAQEEERRKEGGRMGGKGG